MVGMGSENLFSIAVTMANELDSLYRDDSAGRTDLLEFMDTNGWFGISHTLQDHVPMLGKRALPRLRDPLTLWLSAYKKPGRDKLTLMLQHFSAIYPKTCALYREFVWDRHLEDETSTWKLLDYLFCEIDREITAYSEADFKALVKRMSAHATRAVARLFAEFLRTAEHNGRPLTKWSYSFAPRDLPALINDAYPIADFAVMAYHIFNEGMWAKQGLVEKAVQSKVYADLWLFAALHFICALRKSDMKRLPAPALPYEADTVLKRIAGNSFPKQDALSLVEELGIRLKLKPMNPSKTAAYEKGPELSVFVPESLKEPLGLIMAISLAHHPEVRAGDGFIRPLDNLSVIRNFWGDHFVAALGNRRFSSRRCNKSYLQGIDSIGGNDGVSGKPKGYMLAALARSHKSGIATLSQTTDIYLKDARFSGYRPEFIMRQMFERGVFSFIPAVLLEMYAGSDYITLPVAGQTELICGVGLAAHQIERMADMVDHALLKSRKAVHDVLKTSSDIQENVFVMLQNIASGNAPGRQREYLCLMTAAGFPCAYADRGGCIGCGYEIYTKTAMHTLMKEYARLTCLENSANKPDAWRYERILEHAILPAVSEILSSMKLLYPQADIAGLLDIMEKGLGYGDCCIHGNERRVQALDGYTGN